MYRVILDLSDDQIDHLTTALEEARDRHGQAVRKADRQGMTNMRAVDERDAYDELLDTVNEAVSEADAI